MGKIVEEELIPDSHLHKCVVDNGKEKLQIVCGASNARKGIKVVIANVGVQMLDGAFITKGTLRGVESDGMLCSARELNIKYGNNEGIIEVKDGLKLGGKFTPVYINLK